MQIISLSEVRAQTQAKAQKLADFNEGKKKRRHVQTPFKSIDSDSTELLDNPSLLTITAALTDSTY